MTIFAKVWKPFLMIRISIHHHMWWGKKDFFFYMCVNLPSKTNSCEGNSKNIKGYSVFILSQTLKQMDIQIINGMSTLKMWKMCNYKMWQAKVDM
jgi:hypothetical protein